MTSLKALASEKPKRRVLVVEDDTSIMLGLRINLEADGYVVLSAEDGERGLEIARRDRPDLLILDVMLPKMNGFQVLQAIRREGMMMPIIVLSARTGEMDKVTGLELGAEDYVAKPFSLAELLARVRAALRRGAHVAEAPRSVHVFGSTRVDIAARTVTRDGRPVEMTATEFDVLLCLIEARGIALKREAIFTRVWGPNHHGTPRTIDNFVQQLRSKLEPHPQRPRHLMTVRGVGYRFDG
ncbi:MAG: response regulator transcription factor [Myxococcota bacterium]|nr:response regulator transcription factor [Myxococcota bacterium]